MTSSGRVKVTSSCLFTQFNRLALRTSWPCRQQRWLMGHASIYAVYCLALSRNVDFKGLGQVFVRVQFVGEIHPSYTTVCMNLKGKGQKQEVKGGGVNMQRCCRRPWKLPTCIFTVSTYLVLNELYVCSSKLILMCFQEAESINGTQATYTIAFISVLKVVRVICRWMFLSSITLKKK